MEICMLYKIQHKISKLNSTNKEKKLQIVITARI